jgi:hypothetical protein
MSLLEYTPQRARAHTHKHDSGGVADPNEGAEGGSDQGTTRLHKEANSVYTWYLNTGQKSLELYHLSWARPASAYNLNL